MLPGYHILSNRVHGLFDCPLLPDRYVLTEDSLRVVERTYPVATVLKLVVLLTVLDTAFERLLFGLVFALLGHWCHVTKVPLVPQL